MSTCDECGQKFDTEHGVATHFSMVHGKPTLSCDNCGVEFERRPCDINETHNFCTDSCESQYRTKRVEVECCICGQEVTVQSCKYKEHSQFICSNECRSVMMSGEGNPMHGVRGEDAPNWQGGEQMAQDWRHSAEWYKARREALDRDSNNCQDCGTSEDLHVHHIEPVSEGGAKFDTGNLITLCQEHHYERH